MANHEFLLKPFRLRHLELRNRVVTTAHAPAYAEEGMPRERYQLYQEERAVDQVVCEHGTLPNDEPHFALKEFSTNLGEVDYYALRGNRPPGLEHNSEGGLVLFRVGDAVVSRNIHGAIFDSLRLSKDL